jgi:hypothetical protein
MLPRSRANAALGLDGSPQRGSEVEKATLGQTGDTIRAQSRELKFWGIFNSRAAQPAASA